MATENAFIGSIPEHYDRHMGPMLFEPFARELAARFAGFTGALLEIAAGTGRLTRALALALDGGTVTATDLSEPMLAEAARQVDGPNISFRPADACDLPFPDGAFDAVVCQFGVMFFPDKAKAFAEARRVLRPGGTFVFSVWDALDRNPLIQTFYQAVASCFPDDPPAFLQRGPFSYHDREAIEEDLGRAGLRGPRFETVRLVTPSPSAADAGFGLCNGTPLAAEIRERAPGREQEVVDAVTAAISERFGPRHLRPEGQAIVVTVTA